MGSFEKKLGKPEKAEPAIEAEKEPKMFDAVIVLGSLPDFDKGETLQPPYFKGAGFPLDGSLCVMAGQFKLTS